MRFDTHKFALAAATTMTLLVIIKLLVWRFVIMRIPMMMCMMHGGKHMGKMMGGHMGKMMGKAGACGNFLAMHWYAMFMSIVCVFVVTFLAAWFFAWFYNKMDCKLCTK